MRDQINSGLSVRKTRTGRLLGASSVLALAVSVSMGGAISANAQEAAGSTLDEIVVTGTRITGFTAPTPVTSVSSEALEVRAVQNIAEVLDDIPQLRVNQNIGKSSEPIGFSALDLRGLGSNRTLVLFDGRRFAATDPSGIIDINIIPTSLVERFDVVTGGASAAYGSDAVSGVVNFFVDKSFDGFKADVQYGETAYEDMRKTSVSAAYGRGFLDDRLHVAVSGDYYRNSGQMNQVSRPWARPRYALLVNPAYAPGNGQPRQFIRPNATHSLMTAGGVINATTGPLAGIEFGPGGVPEPFVRGINNGGTYSEGGDGGSFSDAGTMMPKIERRSFYTRADYDVSDNIKVWGEILYSRTNVFSNLTPNYDNGTLVIQRDNAYLPASVRATMTANNIANFRMGRLILEDGEAAFRNESEVKRYAAGIEGSFGEWKWDAYLQASRNAYESLSDHNRENAKWLQSVDAVVGPNGQVVCRSTLTAPGNGCVPANVFGAGSISPAAVAYYTGTSWQRAEQSQDIVAANLSGSPFKTWAGDVQVALGAEYRTEETVGTSDPISQRSGWRSINAQPLSGSYDVREGYVEVVVPLANETPWAYNLEFNGAARLTDYSTSGSVTTWKAGLNYSPIQDIRFRGTVSRDIRAPSVNELFAGGNQVINSVVDRRDNVARQTTQLTGGNTGLTPEIADTRAIGVVWQPSFFSGFRISVDYYSIEIQDAISALNGQQIVDGCFAGQAELCGLISRDPGTGFINRIVARLFNADEFTTNGVDLEAEYKFGLNNPLNGSAGEMTLRLLTNYVGELVTVSGGRANDYVGNTQPGPPSGVPEWRANFEALYQTGPAKFGAFVRYVHSGTYNSTFIEGIDIDENDVPSRTYLDLSASYKINSNIEAFGRVENVFNTDPPITANGIIAPTIANSPFHDRNGRFMTVGMRLRY